MAHVNKEKIQLLICVAAVVFYSEAFAASSNAKTCSREELFGVKCNFQYATQRRDCLITQIAKIKKCEEKADALDQELVQKIMEKAKATTDPLKNEKVDVLNKLREIQKVLASHRITMKFKASTFVDFVKSFTSDYKTSESQVQQKLQEIFRSASESETVQDMIGLRFSLENLLENERTQSIRFSRTASKYALEYKERADILYAKLKEYGDLIDRNDINSSIPTYEREGDLARGIDKYAAMRFSKLEDGVRKLVQEINAKIIVLQPKEIDREREQGRSFQLAKIISKQVQFNEYVIELVDDAFFQNDYSKIQNFEYFGARFKGVQKFMTLASLCAPDSLSQPQNNWLSSGCKIYEKYLPRAKRDLTVRFPKSIKLNLTNISWDKPDIKELPEALAALNQGNLERAIDLYDQLLMDLEHAVVKP